MAKRDFTASEWVALTEQMQLMLLEALATSKRWERGELKFQGGTALRLIHRSPRFSEDLDFITHTDVGLDATVRRAVATLQPKLRVTVPSATVTVSARAADDDGSPKNPRAYAVAVGSPDWYRSLKVKLEFYVAPLHAVAKYEAKPSVAKLNAAMQSPLEVRVTPAFVEAAVLEEICVDKIHAIACRDYLKHRDLFDVWWLADVQGVSDFIGHLKERYETHRAMYKGSPRLEDLPPRLERVAAKLALRATRDEAAQDLQRWLHGTSLAEQSDLMLDRVADLLSGLCAEIRSLPSTPSAAPRRPRRRS